MSRDLFYYLYSQDKYRPILNEIIDTALTDTQRKYFVDYYIKDRNQKYIAQTYGVTQAVVSSTVITASDKVNKMFQIFLTLERKGIEWTQTK